MPILGKEGRYTMSESAGQIALDLVLSHNKFQAQLNGLTKVAKKAGAILGSAFAVKGLADFTNQCIDLGSDLSEVQNVVNVAFPSMNKSIDEFARNAATQFGLSETMAKRYAGTMGAMSQAFGFNEKAAAEMSTTLTGLAGDIASFYNISQDEAFTKLKSVFTGETESLKDLGVVMTQTALDQYALANGFGKTTQKMSEQEKVALRYQFVQEQLAKASEDFARTSDGWANQMRILNLQLDSLKATLGQGFINLFSPIIKQVNILIGKLSTLANSFRSFTELITGKKADNSGIIDTQSSVEGIADSAGEASDNVDGIGDSASSAAKKVQKALMGFDKIQKATESSDSSSGTSGSSSASGSQGVNYGQVADVSNNAFSILGGTMDAVKNKFTTIAGLFTKGLSLSYKSEGFEKIKTYLTEIGTSLKGIFTSPELLGAVDSWSNSVALNLGKVTGSAASIGTSIATMLVGGVNKYLTQNSGFIKDKIVQMFNISSRRAEILGNFSVAIADIFTVFEGEKAQQIVADILAIFGTAFLSASTLAMQFGVDVIDAITAPIVKNKDKIKQALENTLTPVSSVISSVKGSIEEIFQSIQENYDTYVKPSLGKLKNDWSKTFGTALEAYNKYIVPAFNNISKKISELLSKYVTPMAIKFSEVAGKVVAAIATIRTTIQPFIDWLIPNVFVVIAAELQTIWSAIQTTIQNITKIISGQIDVIGGLADFVSGVFTGDWKKAWDGIKAIFSGFWTFTQGILGVIKNGLSAPFKMALTAIKTVWSGIATWFSGKLTAIKNVFANIATWFGEKFSSAYSKVTGAFSNVKSFFKDNVWGAIKGCFSNVTTWFRTTFSEAWQAVKDVFSTGGKIFSGIKEGIADTFKVVVNGLISGINKIISKPFSQINGMLNQIKDISVAGVKPFEKLWSKNPLTVPQIPKLAQGGFVQKNTPQLAMIGDNRHYGEIVAPEDKMQAMVDEAVARAGGNGVTRDELERIIDRAVMRLIAALASVGFNIDGETLARLEKSKSAALDRRYNNVSIV